MPVSEVDAQNLLDAAMSFLHNGKSRQSKRKRRAEIWERKKIKDIDQGSKWFKEQAVGSWFCFGCSRSVLVELLSSLAP
eukprot:1898588-Pleurochrysis_carterae.AAC.1